MEVCHAALVLARLHCVQGEVGVALVHNRGETRVFLCAKALLPHLGLQNAGFKAPISHIAGRVVIASNGRTERASARLVEVAGDGKQAQKRLGELNAVGILIDCETPTQSAANGGSPRRRILPYALGKLIDAVAPPINEVVIVEVVLNNVVKHGESQRSVSTRTKLNDLLGARSEPVDTGVNADQLGSATHEVDHRVAPEAIGVGLQRLLAPHEDVLGSFPTGMIVTVSITASIVDLGIAATHEVRGDGGTRAIARPARLGVACIGRAEDHECHQGVIGVRLTSSSAEDHDGLLAVLGDNALRVGLDNIIGLIPSDALPFVEAAILTSSLLGIDNAIRMINELLKSQATGAQSAAGYRVGWFTLNLDDLSVLHMKLKTATHGMTPWRRPSVSPDDCLVITLGLPFKYLSHGFPLS